MSSESWWLVDAAVWIIGFLPIVTVTWLILMDDGNE